MKNILPDILYPLALRHFYTKNSSHSYSIETRGSFPFPFHFAFQSYTPRPEEHLQKQIPQFNRSRNFNPAVATGILPQWWNSFGAYLSRYLTSFVFISMATAATDPKVENPKNTIAQPQSQPNPSDPIPPAGSSEDVRPRATTTPPSSGGGGGETKVEAATVGEAADAVTDIQKKIRRAERFGMPVQLSEEEKRNSRAERFGTVTGSHGSEGSKKSEENKRKARAERFGLAQSTSGDEEAKKKARLARFAPASKPDPVEEEKRKARAIRFSQNQSTSLTQENGNGNLETKAAAVGKAGGDS